MKYDTVRSKIGYIIRLRKSFIDFFLARETEITDILVEKMLTMKLRRKTKKDLNQGKKCFSRIT